MGKQGGKQGGGRRGERKKAKRRNERETIVGGRREREKGEWIPFSRLLSSSIRYSQTVPLSV